MPQITTRPEPPRGEYDFQDLCSLLLPYEWKVSTLEAFGRRGQRQNGVDILDLSGAERPKGAQCRNYNPSTVFMSKDVREAVDEAKGLRPALGEFWIMTTAKKSTEAQLQVHSLNQQHKELGLFTITLKTWEDILVMLDNQPLVRDNFFAGGLT